MATSCLVQQLPVLQSATARSVCATIVTAAMPVVRAKASAMAKNIFFMIVPLQRHIRGTSRLNIRMLFLRGIT